MKCLICGTWNLGSLICQACFPPIVMGTRIVEGMSVYSFYAFSDVELLMHYKYTLIGSKIFSLLARKARDHLPSEIVFPKGVVGVGIDDCVSKGYSHTGVCLHAFRSCGIIPIYGELRASHQVSYAGKDLKYRETHPKGFQTHLREKDVVIFDDVITTGTSLKEAKRVLEKERNRVLCAFTLCDAKR